MQGGFSGWTSSKLQTKMSNTVSAVEILAPVFGTVKKAASSSNGNRVGACSCAACLCATGSAVSAVSFLMLTAHLTACFTLVWSHVTANLSKDAMSTRMVEADLRHLTGRQPILVCALCRPSEMRSPVEDEMWLTPVGLAVPSWHQSSCMVRVSAM